MYTVRESLDNTQLRSNFIVISRKGMITFFFVDEPLLMNLHVHVEIVVRVNLHVHVEIVIRLNELPQ